MSEIEPRGKLPLEFSDSDAVYAWLKTQPRETSVVIAARVALRNLPLARLVSPHFRTPNERLIAPLTSVLFRAVTLAWAASRYPTRAGEFLASIGHAVRAANASADALYRQVDDFAAGAVHALSAASVAANTSITASDQIGDHAAEDAVATINAAFEAVRAPHKFAAISDFWAAISGDAKLIESGMRPSDLAREPLWPSGIHKWGPHGAPMWAVEYWAQLRELLPTNEHWNVRVDWYQKRLVGALFDEPIELVYARVPKELWERGPAEVNGWIAAEIMQIKHGPTVLEEVADITAIGQRIVQDPNGASVAIVDHQVKIVGDAGEGDVTAAQNPQTRQLHERVKLRVAAARMQTQRLHNQGGFGNIAETVDEFGRWIDGDTLSVASNISTVWELAVAIGTFIDRDDKAKIDPADLTPKMDAAAREALDQLIIAAAPFVRRFPTALDHDEAWRSFKQPKEPVAPSMRIVVEGRDAKLIEKHTGDTLIVALGASDRDGPQAEKSRVWSFATVRKVVFVMFLCVVSAGEKISEGAATKTGERFAERSRTVDRIVDYLLKSEADILEALQGLPPDVGAAAREFLRRLRAGKISSNPPE